MAAQIGDADEVYATLLLNDTYLPGALVLAHSLRDAGTTKKLAVLVTLDTVSAGVITQLQTVYDYIISVPRIRNSQPANLHLMNRADLHSAFTKINLWKQTQFRKIVYIDADVVAYRAPDELFNISHPFSAAPDIGWPDLFNTGVMVLTPNMGDFYAMLAMAERNISFDGADQGLINMHFKNTYNRISFTYNVTPSAHYQYVPAYRHFQSSINMVHFIGAEKPWFQGRNVNHGGASPFNEMTGRWWAVYDRHYRNTTQTSTVPTATETTPDRSQPTPELVQYFTKGEWRPKAAEPQPTGEHYGHRDHGHEPRQYHEQVHGDSRSDHDHQKSDQSSSQPVLGSAEPPRSHHEHTVEPSDQAGSFVTGMGVPAVTVSTSSSNNVEGAETEAREEQIPEQQGAPATPTPEPESEPKPAPFQPTYSTWDAQRHAPPPDSKPEAVNFPAMTYEMSSDSTPFVPPARYPSPPKDMWYEVPKEPPAPPSQKPRPIFPWEANQAPPSRVFPDDVSQQSEEKPQMPTLDTSTSEISGTSASRLSTESIITGASTVDQDSKPSTPATPTIQITPSDPWTSYTRSNAWDEMPEIERYVDAIQKHRRSRSRKAPGTIALPGPGAENEQGQGPRRSSRLTDFPGEDERPSLPVTPAPIRRAKFWGVDGPDPVEGEGDPLLPAAEGVPTQTDWDPVEQLQKLAKQQSDMLLQKLGDQRRDSTDLPPRLLPFGSEDLTSPTYVSPAPPAPASVTSPSDLDTTPRATPRQKVT
ncbi:nucleotide-diphospho-sugar transferase [Microdochium trichocladiopsis]|uniref:glycogenin glucosyltransferase n=1 Tax=Microdochium trichocladiopsis TaxID=1682393 RepID=A0A9P9BV22_9PEZI|nr:nucleotide-diphospho-sugar transferase [Microdochium trichocladiopsis]KAH7032877.1 nucleotide-diphospho-sugar transferase [Microdochium trichocladiopsis]